MEITSPAALASALGSPLAGVEEEDSLTGGVPGGSEGALPAGAVAPAFGQVLNGFLSQVDAAQHQADSMVESLALGEPVDVHQVMLALNEASDALHLTLTVRGKILDAYQEVMRMPM